jgi:hypothetical protein
MLKIMSQRHPPTRMVKVSRFRLLSFSLKLTFDIRVSRISISQSQTHNTQHTHHTHTPPRSHFLTPGIPRYIYSYVICSYAQIQIQIQIQIPGIGIGVGISIPIPIRNSQFAFGIPLGYPTFHRPHPTSHMAFTRSIRIHIHVHIHIQI